MKDEKTILRIFEAGERMTGVELHTDEPDWEKKMAGAFWSLMAKDNKFKAMMLTCVQIFLENEEEMKKQATVATTTVDMGKIGNSGKGKLS